MTEPIIEQIAEWIRVTLDGVSDPDGTITLRAIRPNILDWEESQMSHNDIVIEMVGLNTQEYTTESRTEEAVFRLEGIIRQLPTDTKADTVLARMTETVRKVIMAGNDGVQTLNGLALSIDCPEIVWGIIDGGVCTIVSCKVQYITNIYDGYSQS